MDIRFRLTSDHNAWQLEPGEYALGRDDACEICIDGEGVSRQHASIEVLPDGGVVLQDNKSTNGTTLDGAPVQRVAFDGRGIISLGATRLLIVPVQRQLKGLASKGGDFRPLAPSAHAPTTAATLTPDFAGDLRAAFNPHDLADSLSQWAWLTGSKAMALETQQSDHSTVLAQVGRWTDAATQSVSGDDHRLRWESVGGDLDAALASEAKIMLRYFANLGPPAQQPVVRAARRPLAAAPALISVLHALEKVARLDIAILLNGETGVGKEVIAQWLHAASSRAEHSFIAINCAALPDDLLEAELFGVAAGAATSVSARPGVLERADGGTLMLDEIGDMQPLTQAKLLRALESGEFYRIGASAPTQADFRIVAATHKTLREQVATESFREDLYYRLAGFEITVPPLRERQADIPLLASHFFQASLQHLGQRSPGITRDAMALLLAHDWPGNVRELRNVIARAGALLGDGEALDTVHLDTIKADEEAAESFALSSYLEHCERAHIERVLMLHDDDDRSAWEALGLSRSTFYRRLKALGLRDDKPA